MTKRRPCACRESAAVIAGAASDWYHSQGEPGNPHRTLKLVTIMQAAEHVAKCSPEDDWLALPYNGWLECEPGETPDRYFERCAVQELRQMKKRGRDHDRTLSIRLAEPLVALLRDVSRLHGYEPPPPATTGERWHEYEHRTRGVFRFAKEHLEVLFRDVPLHPPI